MRIALSGSKIHRAWKCPPSVILPQIESDGADEDPAARRGALVHAYLERVGQIGREAAIAECPDPALVPFLRALDIDTLPIGLATEVSFAYDVQTGKARELGRNIGRNYAGLTADEIPCTLDLVGVFDSPTGGRKGYVGDYKTGHARLPPAGAFGQLLLGALCVRSAYGCDDVVVELLHIHSDGDHHRSREELGEWDLDAFALDLREMMRKIAYWEAEHAAGRPVGAVEGAHCDHCAAFQACPAKTGLIRSIPRALAQIGFQPAPDAEVGGELLLPSTAITAANAADVWMLLERLGDVIARAKEEVCGIAALGDVPLPDGRVLGRIVTERRNVDGRIGAEVLEERYGRATRDEFVELKLTMSALQQAVTRHLKPGQKVSTRAGDGQLDKVIAEIERRGGIGLTRTDSVKPHTPRRRLNGG